MISLNGTFPTHILNKIGVISFVFIKQTLTVKGYLMEQ